ncbi:hypothetical protein B4U80_06209, partial [Leptotrombidium deliense]
MAIEAEDVYVTQRQRKDELWQIDLADMTRVSRQNFGFKYILTVIDVLSKFAFAIPLKSKTPESVINALKSILNNRKPENIQSDKGREFVNNKTKRFFRQNHINHYVAENEDIKCAVVERFNRTLKTKLFKYFTANDTFKYVDVLHDFVNAYNNTEHRSIKMKPVGVTIENEENAFRNLYGGKTVRDMIHESQPSKLGEGDSIRISKHKKTFEKGYLPNWTEEVFR